MTNNFADGGGGGMFVGGNGASASFEQCLIESNMTLGGGGGVRVENAALELRDVSIVGNLASSHGGGLGIFSVSIVDVSDSNVVSNGGFHFEAREGADPNWGGGGVFIDEGARSVFRRVRFLSNHARLGGGLTVLDSATGLFENCLFAVNAAVEQGGALFVFGCADVTLSYCRLTQNSASDAATIACPFSKPSLTNCILWQNGDDRVCGELSHTLRHDDARFAAVGSHDFDRFRSVILAGNFRIVPDFIVEPGTIG